MVAPFAGAWIEIPVSSVGYTKTEMSLPSRERGLKFKQQKKSRDANSVAPFAGAWI